MHERFASLKYDEAKAASYRSKFKVYLAGPLNAPDAVGYIKNLHNMANKGSGLIKAGYSVFIPGVDFLAGVVDGDWSYEDYFDNSQPWLLSSHVVYLMPGWQNSKGAVKELALANDNGIPVVDSDKDLEYYARQWFEFYEFDNLMNELSPLMGEKVQCNYCDGDCICDSQDTPQPEEITEEEHISNLIEEGKKQDHDKLRFDLIPVDAQIGIAEIFTHGSKKYGDNNWQNVKPAIRYYAAAMRHITAHLTGEKFDQDSGLRHLDHAITSLIMLRELTK